MSQDGGTQGSVPVCAWFSWALVSSRIRHASSRAVQAAANSSGFIPDGLCQCRTFSGLLQGPVPAGGHPLRPPTLGLLKGVCVQVTCAVSERKLRASAPFCHVVFSLPRDPWVASPADRPHLRPQTEDEGGVEQSSG